MIIKWGILVKHILFHGLLIATGVTMILYTEPGWTATNNHRHQSALVTTGEPTSNYASDLRLMAGRDYFTGRAYLIPRSADEVKVDFLNQKKANEFKQNQTVAYALNDMGLDWVKVYYNFHPEVFEQKKIERLRALESAAAVGSIAPEEEQWWKDIVQRSQSSQSERDDELLKDLPITRYTFFRGRSSDSLNVEEYVILMDVSQLIGHSPLTLLWYAGEKTSWHRTRFKFFSCMSGVTCLPAPHWETERQVERLVDDALVTGLEDIARKFSAYPSTAVQELALAMDGEAPSRLATIPERLLRHLANGPIVTADWYALPGISDTFRKEPIRSLSAGQFYLPKNAQTNVGSILLRRNKNITVQHITGSWDVAGSRVDAQGRLWLMRNEIPDWHTQTQHNCLMQVDGGGIVRDAGTACMQSTLTPSWLLRADGNSYLYVESHIMTRNQFPMRMFDMRSGKSIAMQIFWERRSDIIQQAFQELLPSNPGQVVDLGDGLFWFTNHGLVGVSPLTGTAEKAYRLSVKEPVFGSSVGDWVLGNAERTVDYKYAYRMQRLSSGESIFELVADYQASAFARTAHGKLLAMSERAIHAATQVLVWDLLTGKNIARIQIPEDIQVQSIAFNREGSELWMQARKRDVETSGVLVWQVPESFRDAANNHNAPYEIRAVD